VDRHHADPIVELAAELADLLRVLRDLLLLPSVGTARSNAISVDGVASITPCRAEG
jgi:hypothetical protein